MPRLAKPSCPPRSLAPFVTSLLVSASALADPPPLPDGASIPPVEAVVHVREFGDFRIAFYRNEVPNHVARFLSLAAGGFYDSLSFHRVIPELLVQTGDPASRDDDGDVGSGSGGYLLPPEPSERPIRRGSVVMAWRDAQPGTAGSQWFVSLGDFPEMRDGTVVGEVVEGMDVVDRIAQVSTRPDRTPYHRVEVDSVRLVAARPRDPGPDEER